MDSKLRKMTILSSMAVILLVALLVFYTNRDGGPKQPAPRPEGTETREPDVASEEQGGGQIGNDLSAFLKDPTFFDPEINPILEAAQDETARLSLVVTSVEKDLRIQIVDVSGNPVTGESFFVTLEDTGEYKDLGKDGVIYIGGLASGDYYVRLLPLRATGFRKTRPAFT